MSRILDLLEAILRELKRPSLAGKVAYKLPFEAAAALDMKRDFFEDHVKHELKLIRKGSLTFVSRRELERWAEENEESVLEGMR